MNVVVVLGILAVACAWVSTRMQSSFFSGVFVLCGLIFSVLAFSSMFTHWIGVLCH